MTPTHRKGAGLNDVSIDEKSHCLWKDNPAEVKELWFIFEVLSGFNGLLEDKQMSFWRKIWFHIQEHLFRIYCKFELHGKRLL